MELWSPDFWVVVTATGTVATVAATLLSIAAAAWWRRMDRTEADWAYLNGHSEWDPEDDHGNSIEPNATFELANAGDGAAFRVNLRSVLCDARLMGPHSSGGWRGQVALIPAMRPGDDCHVYVACDPRLWNDAEILVLWTRSPTWRRQSRRKLAVRLSDIAERPVHTTVTHDETGNDHPTSVPEPVLPPLSAEHQTMLTLTPRNRRAAALKLKN